jgi:hypothetical protein
MAESRKVPLDWEKIKYRLREADGALFRKQSASGIRSILKKRAESFAAEPGEAPPVALYAAGEGRR